MPQTCVIITVRKTRNDESVMIIVNGIESFFLSNRMFTFPIGASFKIFLFRLLIIFQHDDYPTPKQFNISSTNNDQFDQVTTLSYQI